MNFVKILDGYLNPRHVASIHVKSNGGWYHYSDGTPARLIRSYSIVAELQGGQSLILEWVCDHAWNPETHKQEPVDIDLDASVDYWLKTIAEAME